MFVRSFLFNPTTPTGVARPCNAAMACELVRAAACAACMVNIADTVRGAFSPARSEDMDDVVGRRSMGARGGELEGD